MRTTKITNPSSLTLIISLALAAGVHFYLARLHLVTKYSMESGDQMCNISSTINCNAAISSSYSEFFGVPIAFYGIMTALIALFFTLKYFFLSSSDEARRIDGTVVLSLTGLAVLASIVMATVSIVILKTLCPFCTAAYGLSFISMISALLLFPRKNIFTPAAYRTLALVGVIIFAFSFAAGKISINKYENREAREMYELIIRTWKQTPETNIELFSPIRKGPEGAKMQIVEYADFLCGHCMVASAKIDTFLKGNPDVEFIFQAFPLDGCEKANGAYGKSCELAMFSYCANQQGGGYDTNEALFNRQAMLYKDLVSDLAKEGLSPVLAEVVRSRFLDGEKIVSCLKDPKTYESMVKQKDYASKTLKINSTPTIYVNKRLTKGAANLTVLQAIHGDVSGGK